MPCVQTLDSDCQFSILAVHFNCQFSILTVNSDCQFSIPAVNSDYIWLSICTWSDSGAVETKWQ